MSHAQKVKEQIAEIYKYGANHANVVEYLLNDRVDSHIQANYKSCGHDSSFDNSLNVFYYSDESVLVIPSCGAISASN